MNNTKSGWPLHRRGFLKLLVGAGITALGGHLLDTYAPWIDYAQQTNPTLGMAEKDRSMPEQMRTLVRYATLAANGHNTQPWKFAIRENTIRIHPDYTRRLPAVDPKDRELWISLGCALENLLVASRAAGFFPVVTYPDEADFISVRLEADIPQSSPSFEALPLRQNTRSVYDGKPVKVNDLNQLQSLPLEPGVRLHFVTTPAEIETVREYVNQGNLSQYADKAFVTELITWLRFNKKEAIASLDGLYSRCSGNIEVPRWLGKMFVFGMKPQQQANVDDERLRSSAGAVVIASETDNITGWVCTGQVYERLTLKMTTLNIKSALLNQPVEVAEIRPQFQNAMGLGMYLPQLLVRFGYAAGLPRSLRRPVEQAFVNP